MFVIDIAAHGAGGAHFLGNLDRINVAGEIVGFSKTIGVNNRRDRWDCWSGRVTCPRERGRV
jgi:hypothetical protein